MKDVVVLVWSTAKRYILLTTVDLKRHTYVSCYTHDEKHLKILKNKIICAREDEKLKLYYNFVVDCCPQCNCTVQGTHLGLVQNTVNVVTLINL